MAGEETRKKTGSKGISVMSELDKRWSMCGGGWLRRSVNGVFFFVAPKARLKLADHDDVGPDHSIVFAEI